MAASLSTFQSIPIVDMVGNGPFSIIDSTDYSQTTIVPKIKINKYSYLMGSIALDSKVNIENIDVEQSVKAGDKIYLKIVYKTNGDIQTASIEKGTGDQPWSYYPKPALAEGTGTDATIKESALLLCSVVSSISYSPSIEGIVLSGGLVAYRHVYQNLLMLNVCFETIFMQYPLPMGLGPMPETNA